MDIKDSLRELKKARDMYDRCLLQQANEIGKEKFNERQNRFNDLAADTFEKLHKTHTSGLNETMCTCGHDGKTDREQTRGLRGGEGTYSVNDFFSKVTFPKTRTSGLGGAIMEVEKGRNGLAADEPTPQFLQNQEEIKRQELLHEMFRKALTL